MCCLHMKNIIFILLNGHVVSVVVVSFISQLKTAQSTNLYLTKLFLSPCPFFLKKMNMDCGGICSLTCPIVLVVCSLAKGIQRSICVEITNRHKHYQLCYALLPIMLLLLPFCP